MKLFFPDGTTFTDITIFYFIIFCLFMFFVFLVIKNYIKNINYPTVLLISMIIVIIFYTYHGGLFIGM